MCNIRITGVIYQFQYQSKMWTYLLIDRFFFILAIFYKVEQYWKLHNYEITHMELYGKQNVWKFFLYLRLFKVITIYLDGSFGYY